MDFTKKELRQIELYDEIDDALWEFIQLTARKMGIIDLSNDEFTNEGIYRVRNEIVDTLLEVKKWRVKNGESK